MSFGVFTTSTMMSRNIKVSSITKNDVMPPSTELHSFLALLIHARLRSLSMGWMASYTAAQRAAQPAPRRKTQPDLTDAVDPCTITITFHDPDTVSHQLNVLPQPSLVRRASLSTPSNWPSVTIRYGCMGSFVLRIQRIQYHVAVRHSLLSAAFEIGRFTKIGQEGGRSSTSAEVLQRPEEEEKLRQIAHPCRECYLQHSHIFRSQKHLLR
ncbi:hypothetical protein DL95DRAFT_526265 [Leptodontidium sp. 2 PMI_412]|nr:hypothetical protein DL95DRAFT_526265 [Leptodontidium sp. 2 PMI_412]